MSLAAFTTRRRSIEVARGEVIVAGVRFDVTAQQ